MKIKNVIMLLLMLVANNLNAKSDFEEYEKLKIECFIN